MGLVLHGLPNTVSVLRKPPCPLPSSKEDLQRQGEQLNNWFVRLVPKVLRDEPSSIIWDAHPRDIDTRIASTAMSNMHTLHTACPSPQGQALAEPMRVFSWYFLKSTRLNSSSKSPAVEHIGFQVDLSCLGIKIWHLKCLLWLVALLWKRFCRSKFPAVHAGGGVAVSRAVCRGQRMCLNWAGWQEKGYCRASGSLWYIYFSWVIDSFNTFC